MFNKSPKYACDQLSENQRFWECFVTFSISQVLYMHDVYFRNFWYINMSEKISMAISNTVHVKIESVF